MPNLNWQIFEQLPGAPDLNFEKLCRAIVRRNYGRFGDFAALANQPGVEFHLKLSGSCSLGDPPRWYGWQCRWYDLPGGRALGTTRRKKIQKAIATTGKELPGITDWVLWTRNPLTKGDQAWFKKLKTPMRLHQWTADEVDSGLTGDTEILRGTYFGELVLTPERLAELHATSVAPIRKRWQPELHQTLEAECSLRKMLGETQKWDLRTLADLLVADAASVKDDLGLVPQRFRESIAGVVDMCLAMADCLGETEAAIHGGDLDLLQLELNNRPHPPGQQHAALPRQLRAAKVRAALTVTNALADLRLAERRLIEAAEYLGVRLIAVLAEFGCGKTQIAAQLTAAVGDRPAGLLLFGGNLGAGLNLDALAHRVIIQGAPVASMEALLAAMDAAGERAHRRLPVVIDGLNESEDPRNWKDLLASLNETLRKYPYVLLICTLRPAFAEESLPTNGYRLEIPGFDRDTGEAIGRYFAHYNIDAADADLPWELLSHPLTLRLFCEVTNPTRSHRVGVEAMPGSLTVLFDRYLELVAERIAELSPRTRRYYRQDVASALNKIGTALWENKARSLVRDELRLLLDDNQRPWDKSIVRALEDDGVLIGAPSDVQGVKSYAVIHDALAGHLIAGAILSLRGTDEFAKWLTATATVEALSPTSRNAHPLAADTFRSLVGLAPRLHHKQLWPMLNGPLRTTALRATLSLESASMDAETVEQLKRLATNAPMFGQLWRVRSAPDHPLNAEFLDTVLRPMSIADRDLLWTEWLRHNADRLLRTDLLLDDIRELELRWRARHDRTSRDRLRVRWVMWTLTSTVRELRDQATRALYWFGRYDPGTLFSMAVESLSINDAYLMERLFASSFGITMAHQLPVTSFGAPLSKFLAQLHEELVGGTARHPTNHWLVRLHVRGIVAFAKQFYPNSIPPGMSGNQIDFAQGPAVMPIRKDDPRAPELRRTFGMDFENYTLGGLFKDRRNYEREHPGHQAAVAHVLGTVWSCGWREDKFGKVEKQLSGYWARQESGGTDRYGKKYGWIGFYTYPGFDDREAFAKERPSDLQIDPSFPDVPRPATVNLPPWATTDWTDQKWISEGSVDVPNEFLRRRELGAQPGPWVLVHGSLNADKQAVGRRVFGVFTALVVEPAEANRLARELKSRLLPGGIWLPDAPRDHYTFAGEIPWSPHFAYLADEREAQHQYIDAVRMSDGDSIPVEILMHCYAWEDYHSKLNHAGGAFIPSKAFSQKFHLRNVPQSFDQALPNGEIAAVSLEAPEGFDGNLLYVREDLLRRYAGRRQIILFAWGERQLFPYNFREPDWYAKCCQQGSNIWRKIRNLSKVSASKSHSQMPKPRANRKSLQENARMRKRRPQ